MARASQQEAMPTAGQPTAVDAVDAGPAEPAAPVADGYVASTFDELYRRDYPRLVRLLLPLTGDLGAAEDLAQEAYLAAHRSWDRIGRYEQPGAWVRHVALNRAVSRSRRLRSEARAIVRLSSRPRSGVDLPLVDELLWRELRALAPQQAAVLALVYVEDRSVAEVAEILGCGEATVRTHLRRGRLRLQARLEGRDDDA